jgi:hypothetical protein
MKPVANLEENFGKVVGRTDVSPTDYDRLADEAGRIMGRLPFPKGVFKFRTHEEADSWTEHYILQAALKKARDRQNVTT